MNTLVIKLRARYMDTKQMLPCKLEHQAADYIEKLEQQLNNKNTVLKQAEKALKISEDFIDRHSERWYKSGQQDLQEVRQALKNIKRNYKMDDRQFTRAHDRYLDPPDEPEEYYEEDECTLAELYKQQQRDREDFLAETYRQQQENQV